VTGRLGVVLAHFSLLSLLAFGGATAVVPEMHRAFVEVRPWISDAEFADLFALAQAAPGPNMMVVTLIGLRVAGVTGAVVATLAMCVPSCLLTYGVMRAMSHVRFSRWRGIVQAGLAPVTVGLVLGSGWILTRAADHSVLAYAITAVTVLWMTMTRRSPYWLLAGAAALGLAGVV